MSNVNSPRSSLANVGGYAPGTYHSSYLSWVDSSGASNYFYPDLVISEDWSEDATATEHPIEQGANVIDHVRVELVKCELTIFVTNEPLGANNWDTQTFRGFQLTAETWNNNLGIAGAIRGAAGALGAAAGGVIGNAVGAAVGQGAAGLLASGQEQDVDFAVPAGIFQNQQDYVELTVALLSFLKISAQLLTLVGSKQPIGSCIIEHLGIMREQDSGTGATITLGLKEVRLVQTQTTTAPLPSVPGATQPTKAGQQNPSDGTVQQQTSVAEAMLQGGKSLVQQAASFFGGGG